MKFQFILDVFNEHKGRYGVDRISRELTRRGIPTSRRRVSSVMRELGIRAKGGPKPYKRHRNMPYEEKQNLLNRVFSTNERNRVWVGDITYIHTGQGFLYLAVLIDVFSRKVIGWAMSDRINENLSISCLDQAVMQEDPEKGLLVHTDRGSQYASKAFQGKLEEHGFIYSMSRKGNLYDNAVMESFYKTLKRELIKGEKYETRLEARQEVFKYIELYYSTKRMHSSLGYVSPVDYEREKIQKHLI